MNKINKRVGKLMKRKREEKGLSLTALAAQLGITYQQVGKYERGEVNFHLARLYEISQALDMSVVDILYSIMPHFRRKKSD